MSNCDCNCQCSPAPKFVFPCSGAADVGEIADQAARQLSRQGTIKMFCLAGIGGKVSGIVKSTEAADQVIAIDGCSLKCASKCLQEAGITDFTQIDLDKMGLKKADTSFSDEHVARVVHEVAQHIQE